MQIAVAGVEHIGGAQAVARLHLLHAQEHVADPLARDRAVHAVIVRRETSDGRERGLPAQNRSRSSSDWLARQEVAPCRAAIASTAAIR